MSNKTNRGGMCLRLRRRVLRFPRPLMVMGIVNVTPDSFSDGGRFLDARAAAAHGEALVAAGAEVIDVGGESTRPGAQPVAESEELRRVIPVIERLSANIRVPISIDTMKPEVARHALEAGASLVNDVGAAQSNERMWEQVARFGAGYVCMHMRGRPENMQQRPVYKDVVTEVRAVFRDRLRRLKSHGVDPEQVIFDVGIGFGKTVEHNLKLIARASSFKRTQRPLLLGVSRKSFIGKLFGVGIGDRMPGSLACACWAVLAGIEMIRAHDVAETVQAVRMMELLVSRRGGECA